MDIAHKYMTGSSISEEAFELFNLFYKIIRSDKKVFLCESEEEKEIMEYFCSVGFLKKAENKDGGFVIALEDSSIMNGFLLFMDSLTNKLSIPYSPSYKEESSIKDILKRRIILESCMSYGDYLIEDVDECPFIMGSFWRDGLYRAIIDIHSKYLHINEENVEEFFKKLVDIQKGKLIGEDNVRTFIWDRKRDIFVFITENDMKEFEKSYPIYKEMPKTYIDIWKKMRRGEENEERIDVQEYMNNPTAEGADKIIKSLKVSLAEKFPDTDIDIKILGVKNGDGDAPESIDKEAVKTCDNKCCENNAEFSFVFRQNNEAIIYRNGEPYCRFLRYGGEHDKDFLARVEEFVEKMNG